MSFNSWELHSMIQKILRHDPFRCCGVSSNKEMIWLKTMNFFFQHQDFFSKNNCKKKMEFLFDVDFKDKDIVKALGARWNNEKKKWYAPSEKIRDTMKTQHFKEVAPKKVGQEPDIDHPYFCQKCQQYVSTEPIRHSICRCSACESCVKKFGVIFPHIFFCGLYGKQ